MPTLYMPIGLPACGKTHWQKSWVPDATVISPDLVLEEKYDYQWTPVAAADAWNICYQRLGRAIVEEQHNRNSHRAEYVWDATNLTPRDRTAVLNICKGVGWRVIAVYVNTPMETCIARNAERQSNRRVPDKQMGSMWSRLTPPQESEGWDDVIYITPEDG